MALLGGKGLTVFWFNILELAKITQLKIIIVFVSPSVGIALMHDDIKLAKISTKPGFENPSFKLYHELNPK